MKFDIVSLIGCLTFGVEEFLGIEPNFPVKWWEKILLNWLIRRRSLSTPLAYAQMRAYEKYHKPKGRID